jgi:hypothetical protein
LHSFIFNQLSTTSRAPFIWFAIFYDNKPWAMGRYWSDGCKKTSNVKKKFLIANAGCKLKRGSILSFDHCYFNSNDPTNNLMVEKKSVLNIHLIDYYCIFNLAYYMHT